MATGTVEQRLSALEQKMEQLKQQIHTDKPQNAEPRWRGIIGVFENDPLFDEAERLGREWRESQREDYDTDADTSA